MKKLLLGFVCASAGAALAVETTVATIDVIAVNSSYTNTVIAIPGLDLSSGGDLAISNLVKTTNLTAGDRLLAFNDGQYEVWTLNGSMKWDKAEKQYQISASGTDEVQTTDASMVTMSVGSGIWISRQNTSDPIYVYAQHVGSPSNTVAAGSTVLLGNPTGSAKAPTIAGCAKGDKIIVPTAGLPKTYTCDPAGNGEGETWYSYSKLTKEWGLPSIPAGTGFWYVAAGSSPVTVNW